MRGYLKCSGVIQQCCRCYALRDLLTNPGECKSCRSLLDISYSKTRPLSFCQPSSDEAPVLTFSVANNRSTGRLACN